MAIFAIVLPAVGFTAWYGGKLRSVGAKFNEELDAALRARENDRPTGSE